MGKERLDFIRKMIMERGIIQCNKNRSEYYIEGTNCNIQEGVSIGMDGFGYEKNEDGMYVKFPHYGYIRIGDNVDIYSPTVICRGSMYDTLINDGTKIAGNCQIGHNCTIGKNCLIGPFVCVGGSAILGDNVRVGQFVYIAHGVKIGNNVDVSSFTMVDKDIPDNSKVRGIPGVIF
jgi:UDP-3-O-[3-hydroxymyristoyl] glucosamine N-acyltransferase